MTTSREEVLETLARDLLAEIEKGINEVVAFDPHCQHIGWDPGIVVQRTKEALDDDDRP